MLRHLPISEARRYRLLLLLRRKEKVLGIGGGKSITPSLPSTKSTQRISGEGVITTSLFYPKTRFNYPSSTSNKLFSTSTLVTTTPIISTTITPPPSTPTVIIHGGSTPYIPTPRSPPIYHQHLLQYHHPKLQSYQHLHLQYLHQQYL